jgi:hypothetical protein
MDAETVEIMGQVWMIVLVVGFVLLAAPSSADIQRVIFHIANFIRLTLGQPNGRGRLGVEAFQSGQKGSLPFRTKPEEEEENNE